MHSIIKKKNRLDIQKDSTGSSVISLKNSLNVLIAENLTKQERLESLRTEISSMGCPSSGALPFCRSKLENTAWNVERSIAESTSLGCKIDKETMNIWKLHDKINMIQSVLQRYKKLSVKTSVSRFIATNNYVNAYNSVVGFKKSMIKNQESFANAIKVKKDQHEVEKKTIQETHSNIEKHEAKIKENNQKQELSKKILLGQIKTANELSQLKKDHKVLCKTLSKQLKKINLVLMNKGKDSLHSKNIDPLTLIDTYHYFQYEEISLSTAFTHMTDEYVKKIKLKETLEQELETARKTNLNFTPDKSLIVLRGEIEKYESYRFAWNASKASDQLCLKIYVEVLNIASKFMIYVERIVENTLSISRPPLHITKSAESLKALVHGFRAKTKIFQKVSKHRTFGSPSLVALSKEDSSEFEEFNWTELFNVLKTHLQSNHKVSCFFHFLKTFHLVTAFVRQKSLVKYITTQKSKDKIYNNWGSVVESANYQYQTQVNHLFTEFSIIIKYVKTHTTALSNDFSYKEQSKVGRGNSLKGNSFGLSKVKNKSTGIIKFNEKCVAHNNKTLNRWDDFNLKLNRKPHKSIGEISLFNTKSILKDVNKIDKKISALHILEKRAGKEKFEGVVKKNVWNRREVACDKSKNSSFVFRSMKTCK